MRRTIALTLAKDKLENDRCTIQTDLDMVDSFAICPACDSVLSNGKNQGLRCSSHASYPSGGALRVERLELPVGPCFRS